MLSYRLLLRDVGSGTRSNGGFDLSIPISTFLSLFKLVLVTLASKFFKDRAPLILGAVSGQNLQFAVCSWLAVGGWRLAMAVMFLVPMA